MAQLPNTVRATIVKPRRMAALVVVTAAAFAWPAVSHAATFTVTTVSDGLHGGCNATCSLRDAIAAANGTTAPDTIAFGVDGDFDQLDTPLPPVTAPLTIDGSTAPNWNGSPTVILHSFLNGVYTEGELVLTSPNVTVENIGFQDVFVPILVGPPGGDTVKGVVFKGHIAATDNFATVVVNSAGNTIGGVGGGEGNSYQGFRYGVLLLGSSTGNHVEGNAFHGNEENVWVEALGNVIGGAGSGEGNTISGAVYDGIVLIGGGARGNLVQGNLIGSGDGTLADRNRWWGIYLGGAGNTIGGSTPGAGNVISGNGYDAGDDGSGIYIVSTGNTISGNFIGTDVTGTFAVQNTNGIKDMAGGNMIGGTSPGAGNVISGNPMGFETLFPGDTVAGNLIGTNAAGTVAVPNDTGIGAWESITIGGTTPAARNVISGNIRGVTGSPPKAVVQGNYIGLNAAGDAAIPNLTVGLELTNDSFTIGGTTAAARNVISGNGQFGLRLNAKSRSVVSGNYIGTNATGTAAIPNGTGIYVWGSKALTFGGTLPGAGNLISGNTGPGLLVDGPGVTLRGNLVGTDASGSSAVGNGIGIQLNPAAQAQIGGLADGAGNLVSGNGTGILIAGAAAGITHNRIGTNLAGTAAVPNTTDGIQGGGKGTTITGNLISGNGAAGIHVQSDGSVTVTGNLIGPAADGTTLIGNGGAGILLDGGSLVIGPGKGGVNVVAGNTGPGLAATYGGGISLTVGSVYGNGGLGIDLGADGPTANDPGDTDDRLQNFPVLNTPTVAKGKMIVTGTLDSTPGGYTIRVYANPPGDAPQGRVLLGSMKIKAGSTTFSIKALAQPPGTTLTATATGPDGTSEFSAPVTPS